MRDTKRLVMLGLFVSMGLALHIVERMIPVPFIAPGAKLGLSNIITLTVLMSLGFKDAFSVLVVRIILGSMFGGGVSGFIYSISGGVLSILSMALIRMVGGQKVSVIGISVTGAVFHNIGQLMAAALIVKNINLFVYLPILLIAAVGTGIFVGMTTKFLLSYLSINE